MSKLPKAHQFIDLSDYGRPLARIIAKSLQNTKFTPIDVTLSFIASGLMAVVCILNTMFWAAGFFLILKSVLDAADGELARVKNTPSYTGRYLDSVADILLNLLIFISVWHITNANIIMAFIAFLGFQLQGTLYNYYYVILRNKFDGDVTSRVFENTVPIALEGEKQKHVNVLFRLYKWLYGGFDSIIYVLDKQAYRGRTTANWFMTALSTFGLGFQLMLISAFLILGMKTYIIPFFIGYSIMIIVFIGLRKLLYSNKETS